MQVGFESFQSYELGGLNQHAGYRVLFRDKEVGTALDALSQIGCWLDNCHEPSFNSIGFLKKHLKERHNRYLCEVCVENKTALLTEQKLYSQHGLDRHLKHGDHDEDNNLIFFHPHCQFCNKYFYSEDLFARHMAKDHFQCHLCPDQKYRFYPNYPSLETHFKITHYACINHDCKNKSFIVFKYPAELEIHNVSWRKLGGDNSQ